MSRSSCQNCSVIAFVALILQLQRRHFRKRKKNQNALLLENFGLYTVCLGTYTVFISGQNTVSGFVLDS